MSDVDDLIKENQRLRDKIKALEAENQRYREALEKLASYPVYENDLVTRIEDTRHRIAKKALKGQGKEASSK